jgi:hypothetical protein
MPLPQRAFDPLPGIGKEREWLGRRAGLARDDEERREGIEIVDGRGHGRRVRRVEDAQVEPAVARAERPDQDLRGEAAPAHPGDDRRREPRIADALAEPLERSGLVGEMMRRVEPAEPIGDRRLDSLVGSPEARVAVEQALGPAIVPCLGGGRPVSLVIGAESEARQRDGRSGCVGHR